MDGSAGRVGGMSDELKAALVDAHRKACSYDNCRFHDDDGPEHMAAFGLRGRR
jgi:hypothetical protein